MILATMLTSAASLLLTTATPPTRTLPAPRSDFYINASTTYFNPATLGPCPKAVVEATTADWQYLESNPADHYFGMFQNDSPTTARMEAVRQLAADFFSVDLTEMALMPSTTIAFNTVATGMVQVG